MAYDMYFDKELFPIAPSKIKTSIKSKNKTIELINEGEVNLLKGSGLIKLSFSILLPNVKYHFASYQKGFKNALYYLDIFEKYKEEQKPFQFILARVLPDGKVTFYTNIKVTLEDYDIEDNVNEGFDIKVNINLMQYKEYGIKTVTISGTNTIKKSSGRSAGVKADTGGKTYIVVSGDTLWNIAKKKTGNGNNWRAIYEANKTVIENAAKAHGRASSSDGHWIYPGTKLIIPNSKEINKITTANAAKANGKGSSINGSGLLYKDRNEVHYVY